MSNTRIIKRRIRTAKNISQITKAMEMVAASKMRRAQIQALSSRPYSESLRTILFSLLSSGNNLQHRLMVPNESQNMAVVVISTDKGLCGSLNTNHFRIVREFVNQNPGQNLQFLIIGKKGREFLKRSNLNIVADFPQIGKRFSFEDILPVAHFLIDAYQNGDIGKAYVSFANFISTLSQKPKIIQLLPIRIEDLSKELGLLEVWEAKTEEQFAKKQYLIEPNPQEISQWLLPYFVELEIYHYLLEAQAAEHSARMVAMKNASDNAGEIVQELTLTYNKVRQAQITAQIAEVATANLAMKK